MIVIRTVLLIWDQYAYPQVFKKKIDTGMGIY